MSVPINPLDYLICLKKPHYISGFSAWVGHIPFAMFIVAVLRPRVIVELGTHYGDSYCAFCQAVKTVGIDAHCYAVDTWEGDTHTGPYTKEVLKDLKVHHDPLYGDFSKLLKKTFDEALSDFGDGSVDLLHIDGWHTYKAVKHDFEKWLPKMSERGIVLFHDIAIREKDFGVWKFWEELRDRYPYFEFSHSYGLGMIGVGPDIPEDISNLFRESKENVQKIQEFFSELSCGLEKESRIKAMLNSWSWRITAPMRWLYKHLRKEGK
jgi:hypothetical protein